MGNAKNLYTGVTLLLSLLLMFVHQWRSQPPQPLGVNAPLEVFSAGRASLILEEVLSEGVPHAVGTSANLTVRQNIEQELRKLGISYQIQETWGCHHRRNLCAPVSNIIATIEGTEAQSSIALMAHYDSVPTSLGVGDDGLAVAAILETTRILKLDPKYKHNLVLVFTDGEEAGLLGAEAFFRSAPEAKKIDVVLNYEGGGSAGVSRLLRTSSNSQQLISAYSHTATHPIGSSLSIEIFARMPNDTDFSVALRHGKQGLDFAFAEERSHYHTINDNLDNLSLESLQHHGENMLPVVRYLLNHYLPDQTGTPLVYTDAYGFWINWPITWQLPICLLVTVLFLYVVLKPMSRTRLQAFLKGTIFAMTILLVSLILGFFLLQLLKSYHDGLPAWPADPLGFRLSLFGITLSAGLFTAAIWARGNHHPFAFFGAWLIMLGATFGCVVWLPNAANTLLIAVTPAIFIIAAANALSERFRHWKPWLHAASLIMLIPTTLGFYYPIESSQGYRLGVALLPFLALFSMVFSTLTSGHGQVRIAAGTLLIAVIGLIYAFAQPLYSTQRLQPVNLYQFYDLDNEKGYVSMVSVGAPPPELLESGGFETEAKTLLPYSTYESRYWKPVNETWPAINLLTPPTTVAEQQGGDRLIELSLDLTEIDNEFRLYWPTEIRLKRFLIDGASYADPIATSTRQFNSITLYGTAGRHVKLSLAFEHDGPVPVYTTIVRHLLPMNLHDLVEARDQALATPVHQGDQALLFRRLTL